MSILTAIAQFVESLKASAVRCPCHDRCLVPGNSRLPGCGGENPSGCRNCVCYGLCNAEDFAKVRQERGLPKRR
jgi:hypothetical protein